MRDHADRIRGFLAGSDWGSPRSDTAFASLALSSFRIQCEAIPAYGAYARHVGRDPEMVRDWREIPPVPASAFKSHDLSVAGRLGAEILFETSGTTISPPGRIRLGSTRLYEESLLRSFARHLLPDGARLRAIVFGPTHVEEPRSSLWFMADRVVRSLSTGGTWIIDHGEPRWDRADAEFARARREGSPVLLLGTTLLFHAYFERCAAKGLRFALPEGSRAMDTGGSKGASTELSRLGILEAFERVLSLRPVNVVNEYGMAEMASQFYDDSFLAAHERRAPLPGHEIPPWVRTRVLDPESMRECPEGTAGVLVHYDLANLEVPLAIQTEDLGAWIGDRILLEGRLPDAERRGCSLPFERFAERERVRNA